MLYEAKFVNNVSISLDKCGEIYSEISCQSKLKKDIFCSQLLEIIYNFTNTKRLHKSRITESKDSKYFLPITCKLKTIPMEPKIWSGIISLHGKSKCIKITAIVFATNAHSNYSPKC